MGKVIELSPALPSGFPAQLRKMADDVESGCITEMVVAYVEDGKYSFMWPSSLLDSLVLTTLAQNRAIERMKE